jgi:3-oxoadipate enol-lactonase
MMNMFTANGIRVNTRVDGPAGAPWLTLVTGIANDVTMWDAQMPALRGFQVLRYDLRGQGGTQATPAPYSIDLLVADLIAVWNQLKIQSSHLAGLGLGGAIAQAAAIAHPDRLLSLAACCCRAKMVPDFAVLWHGLLDTVKKNGLESIVEPTAQRWFSEAYKAANPAALDRVRAMIRRTSEQGYLGCVGAFLGLDVEERLPSIRTPTIYVSGAEDKMGGPPALMAGLAAKVPGARHVSVPNAAHIANIQNAEGFNKALGDFLREQT